MDGESGREDIAAAVTEEAEAVAHTMARLVEESGKALSAYLKPREEGRASFGTDEVVDVVKTIGQVWERWASDPARAIEAQRALATGFFDLWSSTLKRMNGEDAPKVAEPDARDQRFRDPAWEENPYFDFLKQAYLHTTRWAENLVANADKLDDHTRHKAEFYVRQLAHALSPSNFVLTNPELLRETIASKGENLVNGMRMLAEDIAAGKGDLKIRQTDPTRFEVGRNLAITPGKVIFRNELFELIQYDATTETVRKRPVLIVPPWINKYYVLDLTPEKSMIRWMVDEGLTVFCISWINPDATLASKGFEEYMKDGILTALDVVLKACRTSRADVVGYCVGGTLLAVALAYMASKGDERIASATLFTTQVDFTHAGDLKVFVDEAQIAAVEAQMRADGYLRGSKMAAAFNMLRPGDLIWPYVVNTYLKGRSPLPFDLLYWNSDSTRMPAANHSFYLRCCYLENRLTRGSMEIAGVTLDLGKVTVPVYNLATREDHIAPAPSVFLGSTFFGGPVTFVLAGSGHIAGVINPPAREKYQFWSGPPVKGAYGDWLAAAEETKGSWWPHWRRWLDELDSATAKPRKPGGGRFKPIAEAPGIYVTIRD